MRIVMVTPAFPKTSETFLYQKAAGLLERGHEVTVVCGASEEREWERFRGRAMWEELRRRVRVAAPVRPRWKVALHGPGAVWRAAAADWKAVGRYLWAGLRGWRDLYLDAEIVAARPEIVHFEFGATAVGRMAMKERLGCKVVVSFRGYDLNFAGLDQPGFYQEVWEKADGIHCLGMDLWRRAQRRGVPGGEASRTDPAGDRCRVFPEERAARDGDGRDAGAAAAGAERGAAGMEEGV